MSEPMMHCSRCKIEKPLRPGFYFNSAKNLFMQPCKDCRKTQQRERYATDDVYRDNAIQRATDY